MTTTKHIRPPELVCIACPQRYPLDDSRFACDCTGLLEVRHDPSSLKGLSRTMFDKRRQATGISPLDHSGVWRFREAIAPFQEGEIVTHPEGNTNIYQRDHLAAWVGVAKLTLKHEGENPTGSFKDRGMTVAVTQAKRLKKRVVACASTGNTSAALAAYAAQAGLDALVFLPQGKVATGKIAQAIGYGATCLEVAGDFDAAMRLVREAADQRGVYMVNSLNPFRLEGQKTVMWELLQDLHWQAPDWIVVPGGNLGNTSAFGKALLEAFAAGWIDRLPRIATIQAAGANPFFRSYCENFARPHSVSAQTIATAISIGQPVNYAKAVKVIRELNGVVEQVSDEEILEAKRILDRAGIGCEPASACSLAGTRHLVEKGIIEAGQHVVGILTGHMLKDPDIVLRGADRAIIKVEASLAAIGRFLP